MISEKEVATAIKARDVPLVSEILDEWVNVDVDFGSAFFFFLVNQYSY